ncbi:MOB kinase activator 3B-like [Cyprinus carpio]|uniref:MOB kinase activator 3B-like n=1 Tax=Cyprinus carpio TaxID=7962 RepID=A0A9Q9W9Q9_CYPCA|nr:MOB kinase activator 3B-like [Cyprinus carpio]
MTSDNFDALTGGGVNARSAAVEKDISCRCSGIPFPKNFIQICKKILCRLFRVFVHVYIHHFDRILLMGAEAHVNTCYKHFYFFATELNLIERKELEPLKEMTSRMCL